MTSTAHKERGRPWVHPWAEWMDGKRHYLIRGVDFHTKLDSFTSHVHRTAAVYGKKATTKKLYHPDGKEVMIVSFEDKA